MSDRMGVKLEVGKTVDAQLASSSHLLLSCDDGQLELIMLFDGGELPTELPFGLSHHLSLSEATKLLVALLSAVDQVKAKDKQEG